MLPQAQPAATVVVCEDDLSPNQQRRLEDTLEMRVVDLVASVAFPLPFTVICELLGVSSDEAAATWAGVLIGIAPLLGLLGAVSGLVQVFGAFGSSAAASLMPECAEGYSGNAGVASSGVHVESKSARIAVTGRHES